MQRLMQILEEYHTLCILIPAILSMCNSRWLMIIDGCLHSEEEQITATNFWLFW